MRSTLFRVFAAALMACFAAVAVAQQNKSQKKPPAQSKTQGDSRTTKSNSKTSSKEAQKKAASKRSQARKAAVKFKPPTPQQVKQVGEFVKRNMPELSELLEVLEDAEPRKYAAAIRELSIAADRLDRLKKDPEGYQLELQRWKLQKRLQLLAARIRMDDSMDGEAELRRLLEQRYAMELKIMQRNRNKLAERLKKMDQDIHKHKQSHEEAVERSVRNWTKGRSTSAVSDRRRKPPQRNNTKKTETKPKTATKK